MAAVASLGGLIDRHSHLRRRGGITDLSLRAHDAHPHHTRLVRHVQHHLVKTDAVIVQHVARGAAAQDLALLFRADQSGIFQMLTLILNAEVAEKSENDDQDKEDADHQLCTDTAPQLAQPSGRRSGVRDLPRRVNPVRVFSHPHEQAPRVRLQPIQLA